ncbi:hypothetical protein UFOVP1596_53 [uncultured Caudovirales phage]|uniref:Uncharacterized protein n=1 Tax=uncultured Caudovirales phage TaxID=2100421 RepID=A0A6J5SUK6_9CAUD|nr:hypothetical protein UFOVP1596_53 [uncultured Caudovirales phage]
MKTVDTQFITAGVAMPVTAALIDHLQNAGFDQAESILQAIGCDPAKLTVLCGCVDTTVGAVHTITAGAVAWAGRVYKVSGYVVTLGGGEIVTASIKGPTFEAEDPLTFSDGSMYSVMKTVEIGFYNTAAGGGNIGAPGDQSAWELLNPKWRTVGSTGEPAFQNSWTNIGGGAENLQFKKIINKVILRGLLSGGNINDVIFTLPLGYRPLNEVNIGTYYQAGGVEFAARIVITTVGDVVIRNASGTNPSQYACINGEFYID